MDEHQIQKEIEDAAKDLGIDAKYIMEQLKGVVGDYETRPQHKIKALEHLANMRRMMPSKGAAVNLNLSANNAQLNIGSGDVNDFLRTIGAPEIERPKEIESKGSAYREDAGGVERDRELEQPDDQDQGGGE